MRNALKWVVLVGFLAVAGGLVAAYLSLNSLVKKGLETYAGDAFSVRKVGVSLEPKSLLSGTIVIRKIEVVSPEISYEGTLSEGNLQTLQKNVAAATAEPEPKAATVPAAAQKKAAAQPEQKIIIDDFLLTGAKVSLKLADLPQGKPMTIEIPEIHLTGIGRKAGGVTPNQAAHEIVSALTARVMQKAQEAVKSLAADQVKQAIQKNLPKSLPPEVNQALQGLFKKK